MLSTPLDLSKLDATKIIDCLYGIFHRDFVASRTYLANSIYIDPRSHRKDEGKELDFWHLTTRDEKDQVWENGKRVWKVIGRFPDFDRACRLEWVKQMLINHDHESVKLFYHRESNQKRDIRLYLWAHEEDFVVILQKLGRSNTFLVTSFYITHDGKRSDFEKRYNNYCRGDDELKGCEWF
ncbi:RlfB protein [Vibrio cholerae]|nr:RlfB protein [Vibrio cholerae]MDT8794771.1 RlfB protein [Vibrio cholerae]MDT8828491.1 RlfB protein [Vibrio cholerae]TQP49141.1 RlfB protein [Vibrio cholerae]TQP83647.1 RlfB protein [Vibrio cholerae]